MVGGYDTCEGAGRGDEEGLQRESEVIEIAVSF